MDRIATERLILRRGRMDDVEAMHAVLSHPEATRYWSTLPHENLGVTRDWVTKMVEADLSKSDDYVIELDGQVIGKVGCFQLPEIGYILHPDHWRRGYATEALKAVIPAIVARHNLPALTADVDPRNKASLRLLTGAGFVDCGRANGTWYVGEELCDSVYLRLAL